MWRRPLVLCTALIFATGCASSPSGPPPVIKARTIAAAARDGALMGIKTVGLVDGHVPVEIRVRPTVTHASELQADIERTVAAQEPLIISRLLPAGSPLPDGQGGHAHITEATLDPFPLLTIDVTRAGKDGESVLIVVRQKGTSRALWEEVLPNP